MKAKLEKLAQLYIHLKSRKVLKQINSMLDFPIKSREIKNVLILLPCQLNHLDDANKFVRNLRKNYRSWNIQIFDVDKINHTDLNILKLPDQKTVQNIKQANYQLVIDLNEEFDLISAFIAVMSEANYRLTFTTQNQNYFNMQCHPANANNGFFYESLLDYIQNLFVKK
jgi:hypothetical protein